MNNKKEKSYVKLRLYETLFKTFRILKQTSPFSELIGKLTIWKTDKISETQF